MTGVHRSGPLQIGETHQRDSRAYRINSVASGDLGHDQHQDLQASGRGFGQAPTIRDRDRLDKIARASGMDSHESGAAT